MDWPGLPFDGDDTAFSPAYLHGHGAAESSMESGGDPPTPREQRQLGPQELGRAIAQAIAGLLEKENVTTNDLEDAASLEGAAWEARYKSAQQKFVQCAELPIRILANTIRAARNSSTISTASMVLDKHLSDSDINRGQEFGFDLDLPEIRYEVGERLGIDPGYFTLYLELAKSLDSAPAKENFTLSEALDAAIEMTGGWRHFNESDAARCLSMLEGGPDQSDNPEADAESPRDDWLSIPLEARITILGMVVAIAIQLPAALVALGSLLRQRRRPLEEEYVGRGSPAPDTHAGADEFLRRMHTTFARVANAELQAPRLDGEGSEARLRLVEERLLLEVARLAWTAWPIGDVEDSLGGPPEGHAI